MKSPTSTALATARDDSFAACFTRVLSAGEHDNSSRPDPVQGTDFGAVRIAERIGGFTEVHLTELIDRVCCHASADRVVLVDDVVDNTLDRHPVIGVIGIYEEQGGMATVSEVAVLLSSAH